MEETKAIIEAIIFASEFPISVDKIREVLHDVEKSEITRILQGLIKEYQERRGGFLLQEVAGGLQFRTRADLSHWISKLMRGKPAMLSHAAMETLAAVTSLALPRPQPTIPSSLPTTTIAEKLNVLPPLVTLVTRLIATNRSLSSRSLVLTFLIFFAIMLRILNLLHVPLQQLPSHAHDINNRHGQI